MPGSGLNAFKMVDKEEDLVDPFFDSEDDEVPVDMEVVFEAMKHVPLPDIDYPEQDDSISGDPSLAETLPGRAIRGQPRPVARQGILKRKVGTGETGKPKKRGVGTGRVSKRLKIEVQTNETSSKSSPKHSAKVEIVVGSVTAAAAKVAAEVPPDVVTGGIVAENGPRPDFSLWTVEDDLLLKNAMEAGAAMEALAKGAMRFSRRFTVRELRERWRALLYDPEIAGQAAARMVDAEYGTYSRPQSPAEKKNSQELARKRRANSIRTLYYKRRKKVGTEDVIPDSTNGLAGSVVEGGCAPRSGLAIDILVEPLRPHTDAITMGSVDMGSVSPKEATSPDFDDRTFSQMFSLLAAGGIRAVIGAIPAGMSVDIPEQNGAPAGGDGVNKGEELPLPSGLLMGSGHDTELFRTEKGRVACPGSILNVPLAVGSAQACIAERTALDISPAKLRHDCRSLEKGSAFTDADIGADADTQQLENGSMQSRVGASNSIDCAREGNCKGQEVIPEPQIREIREDCDCSAGPCPILSRDVDKKERIPETSVLLENGLITGADGFETIVAEKRHCSGTVLEVKDEQPCAISLVSAVDHREVSNADTKLSDFSRLVMVGRSNMDSGERTKLLERSAHDAKVNIAKEDADTVEAMYRECPCRKYCTVEEDQEDVDVCDGVAIHDECCLDEAHHECLPSALTGESCTRDLDCLYGKDGCDIRHSNLGPCLLEPFVCTFNTEDTEVPSLEEALLSSPSAPSSPSEQCDYVGYADNPYGDADADGYTDNYVDEDIDANADGDNEYNNSSSRQGVLSTSIEPEGIDRYQDTMIDPAELGLSVDRSGRTALNSASDDDQGRGSVLAVEDENIGFNCAKSVNAGVSTVSASACCQGVHCASPTTGNLHPQLVPQVGGDGSMQAVSNIGVTDLLTSPVMPVIGDTKADTSPNRVLPSVIPSSEPTTGDAHQALQEQEEEEPESDKEIVRFSDVEAMVLGMDLDAADDDFSARAESRRMYRRHIRAVLRAEQAATAAMHRTLNARGALATLYGRHLKYYITQTEVLMGRATSDNVVDVDLAKEGRANKVSRQQANIKLKDDGVFYLRNLGRRGVTVNNKSVETGQRAILGSNCLIEVGGMHFIFEINTKLVEEHVSRRLHPP